MKKFILNLIFKPILWVIGFICYVTGSFIAAVEESSVIKNEKLKAFLSTPIWVVFGISLLIGFLISSYLDPHV